MITIEDTFRGLIGGGSLVWWLAYGYFYVFVCRST